MIGLALNLTVGSLLSNHSFSQGFSFVIYLHFYFLTVLDLHCCQGFFLVAASGGYSLVVTAGFLLWGLFFLWSTASRVCGLQQLPLLGSRTQLSSWEAQAQLLHGMSSPRSRTEPISLGLTCGFFSTEPQEKPWGSLFCFEATPHSMWDLTRDSCTEISGAEFQYQRSNLCPLHWEHQVLTTGPPGKSHFQGF